MHKFSVRMYSTQYILVQTHPCVGAIDGLKTNAKNSNCVLTLLPHICESYFESDQQQLMLEMQTSESHQGEENPELPPWVPVHLLHS